MYILTGIWIYFLILVNQAYYDIGIMYLEQTVYPRMPFSLTAGIYTGLYP